MAHSIQVEAHGDLLIVTESKGKFVAIYVKPTSKFQLRRLRSTVGPSIHPRLGLIGNVSLTPPITECPFKVGAIGSFRIAGFRFGGDTR